ncbi:hypothetical protein GLOTRDRAFT_80746 [Gloeophyllum trabeum ATCC 11539]|uniref:Saccharopine dehydrogenase NADP binding domain-containing protein n=1 Tax=Gloeophyllum trabeum (strain ATCC 11539 / FP-39264 / Madison 617) TaxID=670483 RepID=S7PVU8_GLOTA|nr:uncharacterized protein GLOTRDRAFT_80746 [Gloeophyllum trabeum ATCC 11539]EPQ51756.1 hypothetical protein GLOTRDRAFT_80746 [Gloeophyllum trabeum ATCC 11539]
MSRPYDIVVYGASGFTGKFVAKELCSLAAKGSFPGLKWAIAGRSKGKLDTLVSEISQQYAGVAPPGIIIADASETDGEGPLQAVVDMAAATRLVLNCVGPYRFTGEKVVQACIQASTDYLDLCGEPEFIENMILKYHDTAAEKSITIVHAAAFDSVPADLGALFAKRNLIEKGATPSSVEMYVKMLVSGNAKPGLNFATYQSAVEGFGSVGQLRQVRKALAAKQPRPATVGPKLKPRKGLLGRFPPYLDRVGGYLIPYFFADPAIVRQTQILEEVHSAGLPPIQFGAYLVIPSLRILLLMIFYFTIFSFLAARKWGRALLLRYPRLFSHGTVYKGGPPVESLKHFAFTETFVARGYSSAVDPKSGAQPDVEVVTRVSGPELGYVATSILFSFCAKILLDERRRSGDGGSIRLRHGVLTPAVAFGDTGLIEELDQDGRVTFSVVQA